MNNEMYSRSALSIPVVVCIVVFSMLVMHVLTISLEMYNFHVIRAIDAAVIEEMMRRQRRMAPLSAECFGESPLVAQGGTEVPERRRIKGPTMHDSYSYSPMWSPLEAAPVSYGGQTLAALQGVEYSPVKEDTHVAREAYPDRLTRPQQVPQSLAPKNVNTFYF